MRRLISPIDLVYLVDETHKTNHPALKIAFENLSERIIVSPKSIMRIFESSTFVDYKKYYFIFQSAMDQIARNPQHFIFMMSFDWWGELVPIIKHIVVDHLSNIDTVEKIFSVYLKTANKRFLFLDTVAPYINEAHWNISFFKKICPHFLNSDFTEFLELINKVEKSFYVTCESDLEDVLVVLNDIGNVNRIRFLSALCGTKLFDVNLKSFYALIQKFPEIQSVLLDLFKQKIMVELHRASSVIFVSLNYSNELKKEFITHFQFFFEGVLPLLLSQDNIQDVAPDFFQITPDVLHHQFNEIEMAVNQNKLGVMQGCFQKMELLRVLIERRDVYQDRRLIISATSLVSYFGPDFFSAMLQYKQIDFSSIASKLASDKTRVVLSSPPPRLRIPNSQGYSSNRLFSAAADTPGVSHRRPQSADSNAFLQRLHRGVPRHASDLPRRR